MARAKKGQSEAIKAIAWRSQQSFPSAALKRAFVAAMLEWIDPGWQFGEISSTGGVFFCTRGVERRMVGITPSDPGESQRYGGQLGRCPGSDD